ncbi:MAG: tRNA pseudouridine(13) synthase TruD [Caldilineaceae bacterium]|nr:tRNA pseudouridine(13) synthase TruD [Caldilineaceae bacterium]
MLPYVTSSLPGIGGCLRATPDDFVVEEIALYPPSGHGQHLYVNITKVGLTTKDVQQALAAAFGVQARDVGFAGMKDKFARTTQTFSVPVQHADDADFATRLDALAAKASVTVNWTQRHENKLRAGHLLGNRFTIRVTDLPLPADEAMTRATAIATALQRTGLPNYFGPQRFGHDGANVARGLAVLQRRQYVKDRWLRRFLISAYQSHLCNDYLARRLDDGHFEHLLTGDVAKKYATGGIFDVEDAAVEQPRYAAREISFTAPIFGAKMRPAHAEAGALEAAVLDGAAVDVDLFARAKIDGTRRMGRILVDDLAIDEAGTVDAPALDVSFSLPKGAFATTVMRELMKVDLADIPEEDE